MKKGEDILILIGGCFYFGIKFGYRTENIDEIGGIAGWKSKILQYGRKMFIKSFPDVYAKLEKDVLSIAFEDDLKAALAGGNDGVALDYKDPRVFDIGLTVSVGGKRGYIRIAWSE